MAERTDDVRFDNERFLRMIRFVHTLVWIVFAGAVVSIFPALYYGATGLAVLLSVLVWFEVLILALNGGRCPLRTAATRLTDDQRDGFDIFLPAWLARNTKPLFGTLFAAAQGLLLWMWLA
jgi:hypothetical protein